MKMVHGNKIMGAGILIEHPIDLETLREKCPNAEYFSGPYFPVFSPNTGKYEPKKTPYLDTFHTVKSLKREKVPK